MNKMVEKAVGELPTLPEEVQDQLASELLSKVEKWRALKTDIEEGLADLERGDARELNAREFIAELRARHARNSSPARRS